MNPKILDERREPIDYTLDQKKALLLISNFLVSDDNFFLLIGNAGTGKTTIAENVARFATAFMIAPTNAAVKRLLDKFSYVGEERFKTIHQTLYKHLDPDTNEFKLGDGLRRNTVYIVDEASMIDESVLTDLTEAAIKAKAKLIFIGDDFQLEPVSKDPKLFAWEKNTKYNFLEHWKIKLVEVKRNKGAILQIATHLRQTTGNNKPEILKLDDAELTIVSDFTKELAINIIKDESYVVLVSNNKDRIMYNNRIRHYRFKENADKYILDGDKLISVSNQCMVNGEMFIVKEPKILESFSTDINISSFKSPVYKTFTFHVVRYKDSSLKGVFRYTLLISNLDMPSIHAAQLMTSKMIQFNDKLTEKGTFSKYRQWLSNVSISTYGYATSVHKSQGNEWDNVYIDCGYLNNSWNKARWLYTAITRAKKKIELKNSYQFKLTKHA